MAQERCVKGSAEAPATGRAWHMADAARLAAIQAKLQDVRAELRTSRKRQRRAHAEGSAGAISAWRRRVACLLMVVTDGAVTGAAVWLAGGAARRRREERARIADAWLPLLLEWLTALTHDDIAAWCGDGGVAAWEGPFALRVYSMRSTRSPSGSPA